MQYQFRKSKLLKQFALSKYVISLHYQVYCWIYDASKWVVIFGHPVSVTSLKTLILMSMYDIVKFGLTWYHNSTELRDRSIRVVLFTDWIQYK